MDTPKRGAITLLVFGASLRDGSLNDKLADLAARCLTHRGVTVDRATMRDFECPAYDGDVEARGDFPAPAHAFCKRLQAADGFVIASPEYNASMPGHLKNAIDWVSRFRPQPFNGRQGLLLSASPSMVGGNRGLWALRVPFEHLGARIYPDMFSLAQAHAAFADDGRLKDEMLQKRFDSTLTCFIDLVEAAKHYPAMKKQWVEFLGERAPESIDRHEESEVAA
jgi:NAD(P)H-dependent FMN reductase